MLPRPRLRLAAGDSILAAPEPCLCSCRSRYDYAAAETAAPSRSHRNYRNLAAFPASAPQTTGYGTSSAGHRYARNPAAYPYLTPGFRDAYLPTILVDDQTPIFYDPGTPLERQRPVIPDCTIALDVDTQAAHARWGYDPIQLGKPPDLVIEFASRSTYRNDLTTKRDIYQDLKILEYWRFDATGGMRYGRPITGERLEDAEYRRLPTLRYRHGIVGSTSIVLDLNFRWNGRRFTIHNPYTGVEYLHPREEIIQLSEANRNLSAENLRLQAEIRRLRRQQG